MLPQLTEPAAIWWRTPLSQAEGVYFNLLWYQQFYFLMDTDYE